MVRRKISTINNQDIPYLRMIAVDSRVERRIRSGILMMEIRGGIRNV